MPLLVIAMTSSVEAASGDWTERSIGRIAGVYTSLVIDQNDKVHIVYFDSGAGALGYAQNTNPYGNWTITSIDSMRSYGAEASMVMDSSGNVHACYFDGSRLELRYATNAGGTFVTQAVDSTTVANHIGNSIAVDSTGKAHLSYSLSDKLMYASNIAGNWNVTTLPDNDTVTYPTYIAVGSDDVVHIAYTSYHYYSTNSTNFYKIKHAWKEGSDWKVETIDSFSAIVGPEAFHVYGALTIDTLGRPHLIYSKLNLAAPSDPRLVYSIRETSGWLEPYRIVGFDGWPTAQAMDIMTDSGNKAHIAYYDHSGLKYVNNIGIWSTETVAPYPAGGFPNIGMDSNGKFYISYYDPGAGAGEFKLKYATTAKVPSAPLGFKVTPGPGRIDLQWSLPDSTGDYSLLGYCIDLYNTDPTGGYAVPIRSLAVPTTNTTHSLTGLYNGGYWVTVRAASSAGEGDGTPNVYIDVGDPPTEPTSFSAVAIRNNITLEWYQPYYSNFSSVSNYSIVWGLTTTTMTNEIELGDVYSYMHHDLTPGQFYYYKIRAKNGIGWGPFTQTVGEMALGDPPLAPTGLVTTPGDGTITLEWDSAPIGQLPIDHYYIFRGWDSPDNIDIMPFATVPGGNRTYTDSQVVNGDCYYYVVTADNAYGSSPQSEVVTAIPNGTPSGQEGAGDWLCTIVAVMLFFAGLGIVALYWRGTRINRRR